MGRSRDRSILQFCTWGAPTRSNDRKIGFFRAHRLKTERQHASKIVLGIRRGYSKGSSQRAIDCTVSEK
ncbi:hypothetical protein QT995_26145 [Microcoleus sp. S36b_A3]|nr:MULTISPECIES: hypothetical protein [unclassified Tychonema]MBE9162365.1 hypothetical protein [Tychonema sp. LEGE 06208]